MGGRKRDTLEKTMRRLRGEMELDAAREAQIVKDTFVIDREYTLCADLLDEKRRVAQAGQKVKISHKPPQPQYIIIQIVGQTSRHLVGCHNLAKALKQPATKAG